MRLKVECGFGKSPKYKVKNWLENIQMIIHDAENIECTFENGKCFSRARLAKLVDKKIQEVKEYQQIGNSFNSLVIDAPPTGGIILPTMALAGETTAKKDMDEIWGYLMGNEVKKIGVCGMGGAGKTTIMTHVNNRLIKEHVKFNNVIWVIVSQTVDLGKLQKEIAVALNERFHETEDVKRRAGMLSEMLRKRRFALILDDVWEKISLEELGIPEPTEENGCKLVITTRSSDVCRLMGCKLVRVKSLLEKEALELFFEKAELDILKVPTLREIVELMVKQCAGLPLAIVTVASSMKGEDDIHEWRNALCELSNNVRSIRVNEEDVFGRLKFSYDRLKDEMIQRCFLYCALYPEDHDIPKNELVDCWIAEGFVDKMVNLQATEERARIIIKSLVNNCLLLESLDDDGISCVKLHDVVRDMTIRYITSKSPLFLVKAGVMLNELPSEQEWKENLDKVSFMDNLIKEIPSSLSPNCQILSTLLLQDNPLVSIPESFFTHMHGLKILNLSKTDIKSLPNSISELTNLIALFLQNCRRLKHVPCLARLQALEKLELGFTAINEVPAGMEMLANLTSLDLFSIKLHKIPAGILPKLCRLQKLRIDWGCGTQKVAVEDATRLLKNLNGLTAKFSKLQDFNCYMKSLNSYGILGEYCLLLSLKDSDEDEEKEEDEDENKDSDEDEDYDEQLLDVISGWRIKYDVNKVVTLVECNIRGREYDSIVLPKEVEFLLIGYCNIPTGILLNVSESSPAGQYSHLKVVRIQRCSKLEKLFSSKLMSELKNLEQIKVEECTEMEKLIAVDDDDDNEERSPKKFLFPKLRKLVLTDMPELKSICSCNGVMVCDSLQKIKIRECPQLKRFPIYVPVDEKGEASLPPALIEIEVEREWWEALEWDHLHPRAQTLLLPFCEFLP
ncbi:hypothetical protein LWI28_001339 [Acer negundo]|uniref:NB-ARC domain-containing protein n=1 Tax=Acer negundo TaxID=4023 RepID=A0AAD5P4N4_ACENE|nr:hypothetical protein LWI28_001339 [Acer negundo]